MELFNNQKILPYFLSSATTRKGYKVFLFNMAINKKGFILYADQKALFDQLTNDKAGELIKFIFSYVNDENPTTEDLIINLAFTPIKQQLKRDLAKFNEIKEIRSKAGKIGMEKRWQSITNDNKPLQTITNITVNDNVNDNVKVNDKVNVNAGKPRSSYLDSTHNFLKELPNSSNFELIAIALDIPKDKLILKIPIFKKYANIDYLNFNEFCNHFKNWANKNNSSNLKLKTSFK